MRVFFLVLARDRVHVEEKISELNRLGLPYLIICGEKMGDAKVVYRKARGKYDAINFGFGLVPEDVDVVALNDVDTEIYNAGATLRYFQDNEIALVFARVQVKSGPQKSFYKMLDFIRRRLPITASGELMLVRRDVLQRIVPIKPCKAEDSYILFKALELGHRIAFCEECYVETERTASAQKEEIYKRKTVCGIYQALGYTKPTVSIRLFYTLLPFASPLLLFLGRKGYFWTKGILLGLADYLRGDRSGVWQTTYMK